eukprot:scaffold169634_cov20-Prasinocladus_malaysianus.AAC.1
MPTHANEEQEYLCMTNCSGVIRAPSVKLPMSHAAQQQSSVFAYTNHSIAGGVIACDSIECHVALHVSGSPQRCAITDLFSFSAFYARPFQERQPNVSDGCRQRHKSSRPGESGTVCRAVGPQMPTTA